MTNEVKDLKHFSQYYLPTPVCNLCGSPKRVEWAKADPIVAYKCTNCGLVYHDPQLTRAGRDAFYASGYFELQNNPADAAARDLMYDVEIAFLEKHRKGGTLLDVGCGGGFLLNSFSSKWEKHGIEFDATSARHANEVLKLNVKQGEVDEVSYPDNFFDVIVLRGVIEHMADPKTMLKHLVGWLKQDGLIYITSTPNIESLCAELYREKWRLFTADHQIHFSKQTLIDLFNENNFSLLDSAYFYLETPYAQELEDYRKILTDATLIATGKKDQIGSSPAFYGNMLSLIFKKNS